MGGVLGARAEDGAESLARRYPDERRTTASLTNLARSLLPYFRVVDLGGHPKPAISGHLKTGHLSGKRVRDIDGVAKAFSLARHEQCLERRKTATSHSAWATSVVGAAHRGIHRRSPRDR